MRNKENLRKPVSIHKVKSKRKSQRMTKDQRVRRTQKRENRDRNTTAKEEKEKRICNPSTSNSF